MTKITIVDHDRRGCVDWSERRRCRTTGDGCANVTHGGAQRRRVTQIGENGRERARTGEL
jgi:hypothetical protein